MDSVTFDGPFLSSIALSCSWQLRGLTGPSWSSALVLPASLHSSEPRLTCLFLSFLDCQAQFQLVGALQTILQAGGSCCTPA